MTEKITFKDSRLVIAAISILAIFLHLIFYFSKASHFSFYGISTANLPLIIALASSTILVFDLFKNVLRGEFSSDILAGISIITSVALGEYLAGTLVVLMLSGGQVLESFAVRRSSFALEALAKRMPSLAHLKKGPELIDVPLSEISANDVILVFPHETCPVDGVVLEGSSSMNESYLTGEPYLLPKAVGSNVLSGATNGEGALTVRADKTANDSRYSQIMSVMRESTQKRPQLRRIGDQLGAIYTPLALVVAISAWILSGDVSRFLSVLVIATPCPLLIAIPVSIISSISLAAKRGIIIKDPAALEKIATCQIAIFDKTGTLTYGKPDLTEITTAKEFNRDDVLCYVASLERYSRHPLSSAIIDAAKQSKLSLLNANEISERPGEGLRGIINNRVIQVTSRKKYLAKFPDMLESLPPLSGGLECIILIDEKYAATFKFHDEPRLGGGAFIKHLKSIHGFKSVLLVSGDRETEVKYLAEKVGITEVHASQSPEQKLAIVKDRVKEANLIFMGDGINDAPALTAATVGIAFGQGSDVTAEAAGVVILDNSLEKVDELMHIGSRMRSITLQSALGGISLSIIGMIFAAFGFIKPVDGAIGQEIIDMLAVLNALRASLPPKVLSDYDSKTI